MKDRENRLIKLCSYVPPVIMVLIILLFIILTGGKILSPLNMTAFLERVAVLIICASGMIFIIAQGSIDLAAGAVVGFVGTVSCMLADKYSIALLFPLAILMGGLFGLINGVLVTKAKVSSFLTTLCMSMILRAAMGMLLSASSFIASKTIKSLMNFEILIPLAFALIALSFYVYERTPIGYYLRAVGENEVASRYAGVSTDRIRILGFVISGVMSGIAGVLTISRLGSAANTTGTMFELQTMISIFLGGVLVTGGRSARYHKVLLGCITYMFLDNGMSILRVDNLLNQCIRGGMLILIVSITIFCDKLQNKRSGNKLSVTL